MNALRDVRVKRAFVFGGLVLLAVGLIANIGFLKGVGIGVALVGFIAAGGA